MSKTELMISISNVTSRLEETGINGATTQLSHVNVVKASERFNGTRLTRRSTLRLAHVIG